MNGPRFDRRLILIAAIMLALVMDPMERLEREPARS
jgi:hypothetical protein